MTRSPLSLTKRQILAFRRHVGALDERLPRGRHSLRRAAWAGLQDSMPRAALLSIHARVQGTDTSTWEDPSLVQLWRPRHHAYIVATRDLAVFSLGRLPDDVDARRIAEDLAARLHAQLGGARITYGEAGSALREHPNRLRYAAPTGTVVMRWDGAQQPTISTVPPPELDPRAARLELARRYLHIFGPTTPEAFAEWVGIAPRLGVRRAPQVADPGANTDRRRVDPDAGRADVPPPPGVRGARTAPPQRRCLPPPPRRRSRTPGPQRRSSPWALDLARLAECPPRRGRGRGDVAAHAGDRLGPGLAPPPARGTRCFKAEAASLPLPGVEGRIVVHWDA